MSIDLFWSWLAAQPDVSRWPPDGDLLERVGERLHALDAGLGFEVCKRDETIELAISAAGIQERFGLVRELVAAAPSLPGISVVAFRQRGPVSSGALRLADGRKLSHEDIWFRLLRRGTSVGLAIHVRDLPADRRGPLPDAVYILLDNALGELDVVTNIAWIDWAPLPQHPERAGLSPLTALPAAFDLALGRS